MEKYEPYVGDWLSFAEEFENILPPPILSKNFSFLKECWEWGYSPVRASELLIKRQRIELDRKIN
tara:strand:- start:347 stop:541 length:195 start_codon:yes stop_codon:yes gene_type:complete